MENNYMRDNSSQVVEDIKWILFDDRNYDSFTQFEAWVGDGHSFIIKDEDEQEYRVTVTKEYKEELKMFNSKERISVEEAEVKIKDLADGYISDGYDDATARSMAISYLKVEYEW